METLPLRRAMATVLIAALVPAVEPPGPAATVAEPPGAAAWTAAGMPPGSGMPAAVQAAAPGGSATVAAGPGGSTAGTSAAISTVAMARRSGSVSITAATIAARQPPGR